MCSTNNPKPEYSSLRSVVCEIFTDVVIAMETTLPARNSAAKGQSFMQTSTYRQEMYWFIKVEYKQKYSG